MNQRCSKCNGRVKYNIKRLGNNKWLFTCLNCNAETEIIYAENEEMADTIYNNIEINNIMNNKKTDAERIIKEIVDKLNKSILSENDDPNMLIEISASITIKKFDKQENKDMNEVIQFYIERKDHKNGDATQEYYVKKHERAGIITVIG
jgi:hypothetical protein